MQIGVIGLGHLGTVAASCLAKHFHVKIWDADPEKRYKAHNEPAIEELWQNRITSGCLQVTKAEEVAKCDLVWLAIDTPLSDKGPNTSLVFERAGIVLQHCAPGTPVLVSSQLPVGSVAKLESLYPSLQFACHPENLRVGAGLHGFEHAERVVIGVRANTTYKTALASMFKPFTENIIWMGVESAEMTKHAINVFLATSIAIANEMGVLAMYVGADPREVEQGMKSDSRIGPRAYVASGGGPGAHLMRDLEYLNTIAMDKCARGAFKSVSLFSAVKDCHERFGGGVK